MKNHNFLLEEIAKIPINVESLSDDGAREEECIEKKTYETTAGEMFNREQLKQLKIVLNREYTGRRDNRISVYDYAYFSTGGSVFSRIKITLKTEGELNERCLYSFEDVGFEGYKKCVFFR